MYDSTGVNIVLLSVSTESHHFFYASTFMLFEIINNR